MSVTTPNPTTIIAVPNRLAALDGWRAVACLLVLFYHTGFSIHYGPVVVWGYTGVHMFFVLSGYLVYRPFCRAMLTDTRFDFTNYGIRRFLRIYPPYLLALIVFTVVRYAIKAPHIPSAHNLLMHLLLAFNSSDYGEFYGINPVFWTLAIEMQFYLVLPIAAALLNMAFRRRSSLAAYGTAILFLVLGLASRALEVSFTREPSMMDRGVIRFHTVFSYLDLFACGMFVAAYTSVNSTAGRLGGFARLMLLLSGISLFLAANVWAANDGHWVETNHPFYLWGFPPVLCTGIAALLLVVLRGDGFLTSLLATRPFVYVGRISYSIYLFHTLVQVPVFRFFALPNIPDFSLHAFCLGCISLGPTLMLAVGVYYLVEVPFLRLAKRFRDRWPKSDVVTMRPLAGGAASSLSS